jgi:hypothetical protein
MLCAYVMSTLIVYSLNNVRAAVDNLMLYSVFNYWGRLLISGTGRCPNSEAPPLPPPPPPPTLEITFIVRYFSPVTGKGARSLIKFALSHTKPTLLLSTRPFPSRHHPDFICLIARLKPPHSFFFHFYKERKHQANSYYREISKRRTHKTQFTLLQKSRGYLRRKIKNL